MAGKIQKPYDQLQNKRGNRRRPPIVLRPVGELTEEERAQRDAALNVAIGQIGRAFGRGAIPKAAPPTPRAEPWKRKYKPKAERRETPAKSKVAKERPRDARGHFLPSPNSRRARIRAANAALPADLLALVGESDDVA